MNSQPSSVIENGFTAQLINSVTLMPRQCWLTFEIEEKSIFNSIGIIINHTSTATGRLTLAISAAPIVWKTPGAKWPSEMPTTMQANTQRVR